MVSREEKDSDRLRPRRGYTVFEFTIAVILLVVASTVTAKVVGWVAAERRAADRQLWAMETLSNAMERLSTSSYEGLNTESAKAQLQAIEPNKGLVDADWTAEVVESPDASSPSKRIRLSVRWKTRSGEWIKPVQLTSWVYPGRKTS